MTFHSHSHLFEWSGLDKTKTPGRKKVRFKISSPFYISDLVYLTAARLLLSPVLPRILRDTSVCLFCLFMAWLLGKYFKKYRTYFN